MEIFLVNGKTYLLAFENEKERDLAYDNIMSLDLPNRVDYEYEVSGGTSNFEFVLQMKEC